ncbi:hypothetical protein MMC18_001905 [Xylographa bjoerkii]|nr:hypothetical protein [Xylographa bjoerkii]
MERSSRELYVSASRADSNTDEITSSVDRESTIPAATTLAELYDRLDADFLSILHLLVEFGIDSVDLTRIGVARIPENNYNQNLHSRLAYSLGTGHTCNVVRHVNDEDIGDSVPKGTVVALKKYVPNLSATTQDEESKLTQTFNTIRRELKVYCHPELRKHENICRLLYIGWEAESPLPVLAMELAAYGSLDDILRAAGTGPTQLQKCNLTIDIGLGLAALHECNIVHGDIKPANIVVQKHPQRQVVAKLTDFGGSANVSKAHSVPNMGTELWAAPEVLFGDEYIDWKKTDVYAYGLVVASIWTRPNLYLTEGLPNSCFLKRYISSCVTMEEKCDQLFLIKSELDSNDGSVLGCAFRVLDEASISLTSAILKSSLSTIPQKRKEIEALVNEDISHLASRIERTLSPRTTEAKSADFLGPNSGIRLFKVWSLSYQARGREFQKFILNQMLVEVKGAGSLLQRLPHDLPNNMFYKTDVDSFLDTMVAAIHAIISNTWGECNSLQQHISRLAFHISISFFLGLGATVNEMLAMEWLSIAAIGGNPLAVYLAPLMQPSCLDPDQLKGPEQTYLALGALGGSKESLDILRSNNSMLYSVVLRTIQTRYLGEHVPKINTTAPYLLKTVVAYRETQPVDEKNFDILKAIKSHNANLARLLLERGVDASSVDQKTFGTLHALTLLDDGVAASLAPMCFANGARLDLSAKDHSTALSFSNPLAGTPLGWALQKNKGQLFDTLLALHEKHGVPVQGYGLMCISAALMHNSNMLRKLFTGRKRDSSLFLKDQYWDDMQCEGHMQVLLGAAMNDKDIRIIVRRIQNGNSFRSAQEDTVRFLLKQGADPTAACGDNGWNPFCISIRQNDAVSLRVFIEHLKSTLLDLLTYLGHPEDIPGDTNKHNALQRCVYSESKECFDLMLDSFPNLIEARNAKGLTVLHSATVWNDTHSVRRLLDMGADIFAHSNNRSSPLFRALSWGNIEAANLISERCTDIEMDKLLGPDDVSGFTALGKLVSSWLSNRSRDMITAIKWIDKKGGAFFYGDVPRRNPVWNQILGGLLPPLRNEAIMDTTVLKFLFDLFPDKLEYPGLDGRAPLHLAVWNGHLEAVEFLLLRGVNVNLETIHSTLANENYAGSFYQGRTALNIAILRTKAVALPDIVIAGGVIEIRRWRENMQQIIAVLLAKGAHSGSGADLGSQLDALRLTHPSIASHVVVSSIKNPEPPEDHHTWWGEWPEKLPHDMTSPPEAEIEDSRTNMKTLVMNTLLPMLRSGKEEEAPPERFGELLKARVHHRRLSRGLPEGWEVRLTAAGRAYYVNHLNETTWQRPGPSKQGS